jgi:hypothetical protein
MSSRIIPMPYMPCFLDAQQQDANTPQHVEVEDNFEKYEREYVALNAGFER